MSWYELLLTLHILAAALYFGSVIAIAAVKLGEAMGERGGYVPDLKPLASRFLLFSRIEAGLLVAIIAVMVTKAVA